MLKLKRVEPCETARTAEGRRHRKELAKHTVEQDIGVSARTLQMDQIRCLTKRDSSDTSFFEDRQELHLNEHQESPIPREVLIVNADSSTRWDLGNKGGDPHHKVISSDGDIESEGAANLLLMLSRAC